MKNQQIACDLLIAGAGISGCAAAISASRCGAKTILVEKENVAGGIAVNNRHRYICGLYPKNTGIAKEIISGLQKRSPKNKFIRIGKLPAFSCQPEDLTLILSRLINQEKNLKTLYNCKVVGVRMKNNSIIAVKIHPNPIGLDIKPSSVIDATGNGTVIKLAKAQCRVAPIKLRQLAGFNFEIKGLNDISGLLPLKIPYYLSLAVKQKRLPAYFRFTNFNYLKNKHSGSIKLNLPAKNVFRGRAATKKYASLIHDYLRKVLPELKNSRIHWIASKIHEREGLRLYGKHTLTEQEILSAKKISNPIARGYWPIEFWNPQKGQQIKYLRNRKFYQIPSGCLNSKNITNLFATGKCISATSRALASVRVTGTCIYLGEAAGKQASRMNKTTSK